MQTGVGRVEIRRGGKRVEKRQRSSALMEQKVMQTAVVGGRVFVDAGAVPSGQIHVAARAKQGRRGPLTPAVSVFDAGGSRGRRSLSAVLGPGDGGGCDDDVGRGRRRGVQVLVIGRRYRRRRHAAIVTGDARRRRRRRRRRGGGRDGV